MKNIGGKPISEEEAYKDLGDPKDWPEQAAKIKAEFQAKPNMTDDKLMAQAVHALFFADKAERNPEIDALFKELDSVDNLNYHPEKLRRAGLQLCRLAYVMGAKWGMAQPKPENK